MFKMLRTYLSLDSPRLTALLLAGLALITVSPLFAQGWYLSHEAVVPLERVIALSEEMRHGDLYPRWLSTTYSGKGSPFFNFYSPGFYLIAAYLHLLGMPLLTAVKLPLFLLFFGGAWGMYLWVRLHFGNTGGGIAAIVYLFAPYHFVDIYVRGALAEFSALAVLPYFFLGIDLSLEDSTPLRGTLILAVTSALLLLFHNLSLIMIIPFALIYSGSRLGQLKRKFHRLITLTTGAMLGAGISAFYWLPIILERQFLRDLSGALTTGYFRYSKHFISPRQWFSTFWGFGTSTFGTDDGMSFQVGILIVIGTTLALISMISTPNKQRFFTVQALLLGSSALLLTTSSSFLVYQAIPAFAYVQFPWRFLGPATLFLAAACGAIGVVDKVRHFGPSLLVALSTMAILFSMEQRSVQQTLDRDFDKLEPEVIARQAIDSLNPTDEYLPRWASPDMIKILTDNAPHSASGKISQLVVHGKEMRFIVNGGEAKNVIVIPWFYYPGWRASVDRLSVPITPTPEGLLSFTVPQGEHEAEISFGTTVARAVGWLISGMTVTGLCGICIYSRRKARLTVEQGPT